MQKILFFFALVVFVSCSKEITETENLKPSWTAEKIDNHIIEAIGTDQTWDWSSAEDDMIHSALLLSDTILSFGFEVEGLSMETDLGTDRWDNQRMIETRDRLIETVYQMEKSYRSDPNLKLESLLPFGKEKEIPSISIQVSNPEIITLLKTRSDIRYVEPLGYYIQTATISRSSSGCGNNPDYNMDSNDYENIDPGCKEPWNFDNHGIESAWNCSQGDNVGICIIDTGASDNQDNLGSQFTSGYSGGRSISKLSTLYSGWWIWSSLDSPHDQCGHGTSMAGLAAAPRGTDGNATGVAYKSNLLTIRAVEDVIISSSNEKNGVKDALITAGNNSGIKVISMSIGSIFTIGKVKDGVIYAHNKGKLIMAAAGTSTSFTNWYGVIFPANMQQTTAITGVKDQANLQRCNTCHSGSAVDFVITMQRPNGNNTIALASYSNQPSYVGGSSAATATAAGIAALVWANDLSQSRSDILNILKTTSQLYPNESSQYGYGNINASAAVCGSN